MSSEGYRWSQPPLLADLHAAVRVACDAMAGERAGGWVHDRWDGGLALTGPDLPGDGPEDVTIAAVVPDLDTVTWDWAETLEGDTQVGTVEVEADLHIEVETGIHVDDRARVYPARLRWRVTADPGQSPEMEFDGTLPAPPAPESAP